MRYFYFLIVTIILSACTSNYKHFPVYELHTPCSKLSAKEIFDGLAKPLIKHEFDITEINYNIGLLVAKSEKIYNRDKHSNSHKEWRIFVDDDGTIISKARFIETHFNDRGITIDETSIYMGENSPKNHTWYWAIKNKMEELCSEQTEIIEIEPESNLMSFDIWDEKK